MRRLNRLLLAVCAAALVPAALHAQLPPDAHWRTFETAHFRVSYTAGLDSLAHHAGAAAERARARLVRFYGPAPDHRIELVLSDNVDFSNGSATPVPYDRITIFATPPVSDLSLGYYRDWLELVVDHELTHIFHLDRSGRLGQAIRSVFGNVPFTWPVFPALGTPTWNVEGTAVYFESRLTGAGRVYGSYHDMVVRTAALEHDFEPIDRLTGGTPLWPGPSGAYIYGSLFMQYLAERYGPEVQGRLSAATAGQWLPNFEGVAKKVTGESYSANYRAWRDSVEERSARLADSLSALGLTRPEVLTHAGYYALFPRVSDDSRRVLYVRSDGRSTPTTSVLDVASGESREVSRRNDNEPADWLPSGAALTSQLQYDGPYRVFSDLYRQRDGDEERLTTAARITEPDVDASGARAVAVQTGDGMDRVVVFDLETRSVRPVTNYDPRINWSLPRWSPDGTRIAVGRWADHGDYDVVVLDTLGNVLQRVTADYPIDAAPAWSPDGRWLVFWSDRTGIPNLFAAEVGEAGADGSSPASGGPVPLFQVTNVLTGAFYPDVSPEGRWIYFSGYHADGFHIERIPFDTTTWRPAEPPSLPAPTEVAVLPAAPADTAVTRRVHAYSPFPALLPHYWLPLLYGDTAGGVFYGAATGGSDAVGRHSWSLAGAYQPEHRHFAGQFDYSFAGLGNPLLGLDLSRGWDLLGHARLSENRGVVSVFERTDALFASATVLRQRWRSSAALTVGPELVNRHRFVEDLPAGIGRVRLVDPTDRLVGGVASLGFANYQQFPFSISREDGIAARVVGRRRWDVTADSLSGSYSEAYGSLSGYEGFPLFGFAHHVLAARVAALWRDGPGASAVDVGGAPGAAEDFLVTSFGGGRFLPVRGYPSGARTGTRAWTASAEYRLPLALIGHGWGVHALYLDRLSASAFADAGDAWCPGGITREGFRCDTAGASPIASAGAELVADGRIFLPGTLRARLGVAFPFTGADRGPTLYLQFGPSF